MPRSSTRRKAFSAALGWAMHRALFRYQPNGESGIERSRKLTRSGVSLPVIFMSGSDYEASREAALQAGCVAYLRKPFPSSALIEAIKQIS